jgi:uncharacterized Tic20 family protein
MDATTLPTPILPRADSSDKLLAVLCHVSFFLGMGFILPLIVYLVKRNESEFVAVHSREVLNFHISLAIYSICSIPLIFVLVGFFVLIAIGIVGVICAIVGALKASNGDFYHYPLTIRFIS